MKCRINKCHAACCYNMVFLHDELTCYADRIVNPVLDTVNVSGGLLAVTSKEEHIMQFVETNKCPFLRHDYTCNIYDNRPEVCRLMGEDSKLPCKFRKP